MGEIAGQKSVLMAPDHVGMRRCSGDIVYMPKGESVTIRSHEDGALIAYATYPHWRPARA